MDGKADGSRSFACFESESRFGCMNKTYQVNLVHRAGVRGHMPKPHENSSDNLPVSASSAPTARPSCSHHWSRRVTRFRNSPSYLTDVQTCRRCAMSRQIDLERVVLKNGSVAIKKTIRPIRVIFDE